jgi:hypothetical protein
MIEMCERCDDSFEHEEFYDEETGEYYIEEKLQVNIYSKGPTEYKIAQKCQNKEQKKTEKSARKAEKSRRAKKIVPARLR